MLARAIHSRASQTVLGPTSLPNISTARSTMRRRMPASSPGPKPGSPTGFVTATPRRVRFVPTMVAIVGKAVMKTVGMPARSISLLSVAPQRVPVPQVPVRITAWTPASRRRCPISWPNFAAVATGVELPVVVKRVS